MKEQFGWSMVEVLDVEVLDVEVGGAWASLSHLDLSQICKGKV